MNKDSIEAKLAREAFDRSNICEISEDGNVRATSLALAFAMSEAVDNYVDMEDVFFIPEEHTEIHTHQCDEFGAVIPQRMIFYTDLIMEDGSYECHNFNGRWLIMN